MRGYVDRLFVVSITFLALTATVSAAEEPTGLEYVRRQQTAQIEAIVQYCRENAPEANQLVSEGHAHFISSMEQGLEMWVSEKPGMKQSLLQKLPPNSIERQEFEQKMLEIRDVAKKSTDAIRKYDPHTYCPWIANKFKASTPESVLKSLHEYDNRVAAKQRERAL